MATLHPFVAYCKENGLIKHSNLVVISECNIHDTVAVHLFLWKLKEFMDENLPKITKVKHFSDGCAGQEWILFTHILFIKKKLILIYIYPYFATLLFI